MSQRDGGPAFPEVHEEHFRDDTGAVVETRRFTTSGMTLRDYFASKAMQSAVIWAAILGEDINSEQVARWAYKDADAMLKAREEVA